MVNTELTFENFVSFIRVVQGFKKSDIINENSLLENDLGITGDDGSELLEEIQKYFSLSFVGKDGTIREIFGLEENQYLFHSEGINMFGWLFTLIGKSKENIKPITVGQLYNASLRAKQNTGKD